MDVERVASAFRTIIALAPALEAALRHARVMEGDAFAQHDVRTLLRSFNEVCRETMPFIELPNDRILTMASNATWDASEAANTRSLESFELAIVRLKAAMTARDALRAHAAAYGGGGTAISATHRRGD